MSNNNQNNGPKRGDANNNNEPAIETTAQQVNSPEPKIDQKEGDKKDFGATVKARMSAMGDLVKSGWQWLKDKVIGLAKGVGAFFKKIWDSFKSLLVKAKDFILGFGDKHKVKGYASYAKLAFGGIAIACVAYMGGAYLLGMYSLSQIATVGAVGTVVCVGVEKTVDHYANKEVNAPAQAAA